MHSRHVIALGMVIAMAAALPALAYQSPGDQGQRGHAQSSAGAARGAPQQDRLHDRQLDRDRLHDQDQDRLRDRDTIYGSQLMTPAERTAYRKKMRSLKTAQEREAFRMQHHEEMQKRAQERGMTLPDEPRQNRAGSEENVQQRTEQQQRNQQSDQQIRQQERTRQQEQQDQD